MQAPVADDSTRQPRVDAAQPAQHAPAGRGAASSSGWCSGPRPTAGRSALLMVSGITDFLDGWLARRLNQTSVRRADPRPGRRPALHPRRRRRAGAARHHPVVGGAVAAAARPAACGGWCRCCAPAATARCRCTSSARPPRSTCSTPSRCCCSATARAPSRPWPRCSAGRSRSGGSASTGGPGILYAWQVRKLLATTERRPAVPRCLSTATARRAAARRGSRMPLLTLITQQSLDEDYQHVAERRAAGARRPAAGRRRAPDGRRRGRGRSGCWSTVAAVQTSRNAERRRRQPGHADRRRSTGGARRSARAAGPDRAAARAQRRPAAAARRQLTGTEQQAAVARMRRLEAGTGLRRRSPGAGVRVTVDDAPDGDADPGGPRRGPGAAGRRAVGGRGRGDRDQRPAAHRAQRDPQRRRRDPRQRPAAVPAVRRARRSATPAPCRPTCSTAPTGLQFFSLADAARVRRRRWHNVDDSSLPAAPRRCSGCAASAQAPQPTDNRRPEGGDHAVIAALGLLVGIVLGLVFQPDVPLGLEPYLPIAVVAALDAVFGGLRAYLDGIFDDKVFVVSFVSNVVIAAGDRLPRRQARRRRPALDRRHRRPRHPDLLQRRRDPPAPVPCLSTDARRRRRPTPEPAAARPAAGCAARCCGPRAARSSSRCCWRVVGFAAVTQVRANEVDDTYAGLREQDLIDVLNGLAGTTQRAEAEIARLESTRDDLLSSTDARAGRAGPGPGARPTRWRSSPGWCP